MRYNKEREREREREKRNGMNFVDQSCYSPVDSSAPTVFFNS